jgi:hypothetical protein
MIRAVERIVAGPGEADEILRAVVLQVSSGGEATWAGILFTEGDGLVLGPEAGIPSPGARTQVPVLYQGACVAELAADECEDVALLDHVAALIAEFCLVGWDTGGVPWDEAT